ncbi:MAG: putative transrane protein [Bacteroidetes bacterium]|nr:putative transrane protein [Bacteroidota bacterium]
MQMKSVSPAFTACLIGFLLLSGCLDITTTSSVNRDGTIVRTIAFTGDSAEVYGGRFPVELDSAWSKSVTKTKGKEICTLVASRTFRNVGEMNEVLKGTFGRTLQFRFELDKSFEWFFTVYRYRETTIPFVQYSAIPMSEFLSRAEMDWLTEMFLQRDPKKPLPTRGDSLAFESIIPRAQEWEWRNRFEAVFNAFLDGVKTLNNPSLTPTMVGPLKDSLYMRSAKAIDKRKIDTLRIIFAGVLKNPLVEKAWQANVSGFDEIKRKIEFESKMNSHKYVTSVVMPGLIMGSNAREIEGNTATWGDFMDIARYVEYTMSVESRQVNWWAVIIACVLVVSLMTALIISVLRRRSRAQ